MTARWGASAKACENIVDALNQFDFTGNALAVDVRGDRLFDPQNGLRDMRQRLMRMVRFDYPDEPILPGNRLGRLTVLWFRILHYAAELDLAIEPVTRGWLVRHGSAERHLDVFSEDFFVPNLDRLPSVRGADDE